MKKILSVVMAIVILALCCPAAFAAGDVYCRINSDITGVDTSLPGVQVVGDTTYHVGVGEVLSYDTHEDKTVGSNPGTISSLANGSYGWVKIENGSRPVFTEDDGDTSVKFPLSTSNAQIAYYAFNKGAGVGGNISLEFKVKADAPTNADIRFINSTTDNGSNQLAQFIYAFLAINENSLVFTNVEQRYEATGKDTLTKYTADITGVNKWATVRIDIHPDSETFDLYVDGKCIEKSIPVYFKRIAAEARTAEQSKVDLAFMRVRDITATTSANLYFDDIAVYNNDSQTTHYFSELESAPEYTYATGDVLSDRKTAVAIKTEDGTDTGKTAYVPVRLAGLDSSKFAVHKASIDGYNDKATVTINKKTASYTNDFESYNITDLSAGYALSTAGHTVQQETLADGTTNQFMKIYKSAAWSRFSFQNPLNPGKIDFDINFRVRFPVITGFDEGAQFLSIQLNGEGDNILTFNIEPEFGDTAANTRKRIRVTLTASSKDSSFAGKGTYSAWAPGTTDWSQWHDILMRFSKGKVYMKFDDTVLTENNNGVEWQDIRTDIGFHSFDIAHRTSGAATIEGTTNLDDIYVTSYPVIDSLDDIAHTTSLNDITVPEKVSVSLTDSSAGLLPIKALTPIDGAPQIDKITECGTYLYTVTADGTDKTSTLTLTVIDEAYSLGTPYTNGSTGKVAVPVFKATTDTNSVSLITAIYKGGILKDVNILPVSSSGNIETGIVAENGCTVKAFLWSSLSRLIPACKSVSASLQAVEVNYDSYDIVCWGDSLTYGQTEESTLPTDNSYPSVLASLTGKTVKNMGIGGETAQTIAVKLGGLTLAPSGPFTLGGAAGSTVTFSEGCFNDLTGGHIVPRSITGYCYGWEGVCYLNGIPGKITNLSVDESVKPRTLKSLTFTRLEDGEALTVNENESRILVPSGNMVKGDINVIFIGENGWHDANQDGTINEFDLSYIIDRMIEKTPNPEKTIIIGLTTGTAASREVMEKHMAEKYGKRYINMRAHISNADTLEAAGITPTQEDLANIAEGSMPKSLWKNDSDYVHMNSTGYRIVANKIYQTMLALGFLE